ncbi:MAG TPA: sigma-70 family RNA polymerase sigma factor [Vicinamibacterales bacterium]
MSKNPATTVRISPDLLTRLHRRADAGRWAVPEAAFCAALERSAAKTLAEGARDAARLERYLSALHLDDLALACACAEGNGAAWDHFVLEFRPVLYRAADALAPGGGARDLADSIYADLFGLDERDGERRSLLRYFHGRSSLATWLRAVLAQRHVDRIRSERRLEPLQTDDADENLSPPQNAPGGADPDRVRFIALVKLALQRAVARLPDRDRLRLGFYYREDLTLAQAGRLLGEHEATVSRQLARTRRAIRDEVDRYLRQEHGFGDAEVARCFECTLDDPGPIDLGQMLGNTPRKNPEPERSI